jgi:hypothetical protein
MKKDEHCKALCTVKLAQEDVDLFVKRIDEVRASDSLKTLRAVFNGNPYLQDYNVNWMVDLLPVAGIGLLQVSLWSWYCCAISVAV